MLATSITRATPIPSAWAGRTRFVHNTGNDTFALTDSMGDVFTFNDFNSSLPANQKGQFQSFTDPAGNVGQVISRDLRRQAHGVSAQHHIGRPHYHRVLRLRLRQLGSQCRATV